MDSNRDSKLAMGNGSKLKEESNNVVEESAPPRYEEVVADEFEFERSTRVRPSAPTIPTHSASSNSQKSASNSSHDGINMRKDGDKNFNNDFFQKPPKFLLYPTMPESGSKEDQEREEDNFANRAERPSTVNNQQTLPQAFVVPQTQQSTTANNGVTMSASQLTHVNIPAQGYITDNYLPRYSQKMICPNCKVPVFSAVQYVSGQLTHLVALAACWFTCCLACVPYFIDELKDAEHICPKCMTILGYNRKKLF